MENPNKIYVVECITKQHIVGNSHFVIVVAASSIEVAKKHVHDQIGIDGVEPTWIMNAVFPTIYESNGSTPKLIQAKILYNGNCYYK